MLNIIGLFTVELQTYMFYIIKIKIIFRNKITFDRYNLKKKKIIPDKTFFVNYVKVFF